MKDNLFIFVMKSHRKSILMFHCSLKKPLDTIVSPSTIIPLLLLLILIIYYLMALTGALREANDDLRNQLRRERQEERRKMQRVVNAKLSDDNGNNVMDRWRKVLEASSPLTPIPPGGQTSTELEEEKMKTRREFLARIMKKALRKSSNTSEDDSHPGVDDDETDTEQHEQLPHDQEATGQRSSTRRRDSTASKAADDRKSDVGGGRPRKPSFARMRDIVEIAKSQKADAKTDTAKATKKVKPRPSSEDPDESADRKDEIVAERRLLRRQQSTQESEGSNSVPTSILVGGDKDAINYEVINEKNKAKEKKSKSKQSAATEPEVFRFDNELYDKSNEGGSSDTDRTSYQEIEQIRPPQDAAENITPTKRRSRSPKIFHIGDGSDESKPQDDMSIASSSKSKTPSPSPSSVCGGDANEKSPKSSDDILKQPMKRLNSFLNLVREAVQRKQEQTVANTTTVGTTVAVAQETPDIRSRVRKFIDDSNSISTTMSEEGSTTTKASDSVPTALPSSRSGSSKRRRRFEPPPKPKRQDSQASIWSDNIPVITISKTESDECILEKEIQEKTLPPKAEADADIDIDAPKSE